ncbi:MAG TPA: cytochrome c [Ignavibacteria bacterium]|nr:cytochrome c [Ignavibacteria bacterium]HMR00195.1 cytochrome c [Ignavibacteria bacterium]
MKELKLNIKSISAVILTLTIGVFILNGCGKTEEFGVGPVKEELKLAPVDANLYTKGEQIYTTKCVACHKFGSRLVGPPLKDVTKRRRPEWIMNQILNPLEMTQKDKVSKELFAQYLVQMTFQDVTMDDARALLEYMRAVDEGKVTPKE